MTALMGDRLVKDVEILGVHRERAVVQRLAHGSPPDRNVLTRGWWRAPERFTWRYDEDALKDVPILGIARPQTNAMGEPVYAAGTTG